MTGPGAHAVNGMLPSDGWRFGFAFNKSFHNSLFWRLCQRSVFVLKRCSLVLIQYKTNRHMAGNSPTADIRRWWDRLSPQWEFLSQLGILILLGQHFDIDQAPGMTCMKSIKTIELFWKHMINHVFSRDFYSRMVLFTCRILIGSIVGVTFWWANWSCWTVLWHNPVLISQSRSYFCRQNILLALNFENRIWEHIDVNIDHIFHFQSSDLQVYFCLKIF